MSDSWGQRKHDIISSKNQLFLSSFGKIMRQNISVFFFFWVLPQCKISPQKKNTDGDGHDLGFWFRIQFLQRKELNRVNHEYKTGKSQMWESNIKLATSRQVNNKNCSTLFPETRTSIIRVCAQWDGDSRAVRIDGCPILYFDEVLSWKLYLAHLSTNCNKWISRQ